MSKFIQQVSSIIILSSLLLLSHSANATIIDSGFGSVPGRFGVPDFGGSGIPNDAINYVVLANDQGQEFILGLSATPRFASPAVTNDGAGTFFAQPGLSVGTPSTSADGAAWNFSFFIATEFATANQLNLADVLTGLTLSYDVDSGPGTDFGIIDLFPFTFAPTSPPAPQPVLQASQNLLFDFLFIDSPVITAPNGTFNPFVAGQYRFSLEATFAGSTASSGSVEIDVNVVPEPSALSLIGIGGLLVLFRRIKKK